MLSNCLPFIDSVNFSTKGRGRDLLSEMSNQIKCKRGDHLIENQGNIRKQYMNFIAGKKIIVIIFSHYLNSRCHQTILMNIKPLFAMVSLVAAIVGFSSIITDPFVYAQNQTSSSQLQNTTQNTGPENKTYILIFGQRVVGNIDNSTKIVSSIVGNNLVKIEEEFLEEISLAPSQQLEAQINKVVNDGINGLPCGVPLTTQQGQNVLVDCISSGNEVIWYIYPTLK
jgi:hypothetical protein